MTVSTEDPVGDSSAPELDFRLRPAWVAGFDDEPCPPCPAWLDAAGWKAAYERGRTAAGLGPV